MGNIRYRMGFEKSVSMAHYMRQISDMNTNSADLSRTKKNLITALNEDITPRQRECMLLYYVDQLNMQEIGDRLGVDKSTVSRTIKRGTYRLHRCLRYGAEIFLEPRTERQRRT